MFRSLSTWTSSFRPVLACTKTTGLSLLFWVFLFLNLLIFRNMLTSSDVWGYFRNVVDMSRCRGYVTQCNVLSTVGHSGSLCSVVFSFLFCYGSRSALESTWLPVHWILDGSLLGVKRPRREADQSFLSTADVETDVLMTFLIFHFFNYAEWGFPICRDKFSGVASEKR